VSTRAPDTYTALCDACGRYTAHVFGGGCLWSARHADKECVECGVQTSRKRCDGCDALLAQELDRRREREASAS
jgi:hypothetical protein